MMRKVFVLPLLLAVAACQPGGEIGVPGDGDDHSPYAGIGPDETVHFIGTEPFWGGEARGDRLTYTTPEDPAGTTIPVKRFAGRGGLSLSGTLAGSSFDLTVTPGDCSDGMSDRTYPYSATLMLGGETRQGCAWTGATRFDGPENP